MAAVRLQRKIGETPTSLRFPSGSERARRFEKGESPMRRRLVLAVAVLVLGTFLLLPAAVAQVAGSLAIKPLTDKKELQLPDGPLFWRIENYTTLAQAQAVAGLWGLATELGGKVWLFRVGPPR